MRPVRRALVILLLILVVGLGAVFYYVRGRGFSARSEPGRLEESVARFARRLAIPAAARDRQNPAVPRSPEAIRDGLEHYGDAVRARRLYVHARSQAATAADIVQATSPIRTPPQLRCQVNSLRWACIICSAMVIAGSGAMLTVALQTSHRNAVTMAAANEKHFVSSVMKHLRADPDRGPVCPSMDGSWAKSPRSGKKAGRASLV